MCPPAQSEQESFVSRRKIRCVLAHQYGLLRQGLRRLLEDEPDLEVVSEAANVAETVQTISEHRPEIVIADTRTLGLPAGEAEQLLRRESPSSKVVFLNTDDKAGSNDLRARGDESGLAPASAQELVAMVRNACRQQRPEVYDMSGSGDEHAGRGGASPPRKHVLTAREQEVLKLLAEGSTVRSAARILGLSAKTVDAHKFNLMRKLGIHNKAELVMWAIREQVVKIPVNY